MIQSFEVGAVFTIQNDGAETLASMAEQFGRLDELARSLQGTIDSLSRDSLTNLTGGIDRLSGTINGLEETTRTATATMSGAFDSVTTSIGRATDQADALTAAYDRAAEAANRIAANASSGGMFGPRRDALPVPYAGGGGVSLPGGDDEPFEDPAILRLADGGGGGIPLSGIGGYTLGRTNAGGGGGGGGSRGGHRGGFLGSMMPLLELFGGYEAYKSAMEEDLAIRNTLIEGLHILPGTPQFDAAFQQMHQIVADNARGTIFSDAQTAMAMPYMARELGFAGPEGMAKISQIFRPALQAAEVANMAGLGSVDSSLSASVEYAHMTGAYEPQQLEQHLNVLRSIAQLENQSMGGEESILKYSVPIGIAAGMDADDTAIATGYLQNRGFNSSTAGTGLSAMILGALNTGGGIDAHLERARRSMNAEFEHSLHMTHAQSLAREGTSRSAHVAALRALGITDAHGNLTTVDQHGNFDLAKLEQDIYQLAQTHTHQEALEALHGAFGTRGERIAGIFTEPDAMQREQRFRNAVNTSPTASQIQGDLSQASMQQFEQMLANLSNIGNTLATSTLQPLNATLKATNQLLQGFDGWLQQHHTATEATAGGLLGLGGLMLFGGIRGAARLFGLTRAGSAGRAVAGAAETGLLARAWPILLGSALWNVNPADFGLGVLNETPGQAASGIWHWLAGGPASSGAPRQPPGGAAATAQPQAPQQVHVNVGPISMNGIADQSTFESLLSKLTDAIRAALAHTSGTGGGSDMSPFTGAGWPY